MSNLLSANRLTTRLFQSLKDRKSDIATNPLLRYFASNDRANVAVIFAIVMVPTIYLLGMTMDYTQAYHKQSQLNAAVDAAVIAAVTPAMMSQSNTAAIAAATMIFNATAKQLTGLSATPTPTVSVTNNGLVRSVTVSYTAASNNNFPILLGSAAWPIKGSSTASASGAPNINFFLLLDDSPSMAIAANSTDIAKLIANTQNQIDSVTGKKGCAFACHETHPSSDNLGNPGGQNQDNYALARNLSLTLRIDLLTQAVAGPDSLSKNLISTAVTTATKNNSTYKMAIYTFDTGINTIYAPSGAPANLSTSESAIRNAALNINVLPVYDNNCLTQNNCNNDTDTDFSDALQTLNTTYMPAPGGGTNNSGDTPQEVVFLVTDGVEDKIVSSPSYCSQTTVSMGSGQYRCQQPFDTTWCTTVKNRGIRIAVLYTEYLQLPTNGWYNSYIASIDSPDPSTGKIATNLQSCASPGLFYDVQSGGDISAALNNLFQLVVQTAAHLTQ
jgi:Flp pilus assembly protein TadG